MSLFYCCLISVFFGNIFITIHARNAFSCLNENGDPVDWFIVYKIPDIDKSKDQLVQKGLAHVYMDQSTNGQWIMSNVSMNNTNHAIARTLQQTYNYKIQSDVFHMMYNDEWPSGGTTDSKGHCKGVMTFDYSTGFWLIHSIPKFPSNVSYFYPNSGTVYGQSVLCVTFPYSSLNNISSQLYYYQPWIYSSSLPSTMAQQNPTLQNVIAGKSKSSAPYNNKIYLQSLGGVQFISFAKHKKWQKDLYYDFVAPSLQQSMMSETWQNGGGNLPSNCSGQYKVNNIEYINLTATINFSDNKDHSKWAVSTTGSNYGNYLCIGDINRQKGQLNRGGGTLCFKNFMVWSAFNASIQTVQPCTVPVQTLTYKEGFDF